MNRPERWGTVNADGRLWWIITTTPAHDVDGEIIGDDLLVIAEQTPRDEPAVRAIRWPATATCGPRNQAAPTVARRILAWCDTTRRPRPVVATIHEAATRLAHPKDPT
jgi:hypothetical protein